MSIGFIIRRKPPLLVLIGRNSRLDYTPPVGTDVTAQTPREARRGATAADGTRGNTARIGRAGEDHPRHQAAGEAAFR
ncbi:MAG: hypothetical protein EA384_06280 [Spirochaetaceae bacterium]|nr:MAG: hypothetical protein EA384_06280 [Spirochaetaceae bacterium]